MDTGKTSPQQIRVSRHQQSEATRQKEAENSRAFINRTHQKILDGLKDPKQQSTISNNNKRSVVSTRSGGSQTQTQRTSSMKPWLPSSTTPKVSDKGVIARLEGEVQRLKNCVEQEQSKEYRFRNMEELEYKLRLYVQTIINREMLPQMEQFEHLEKEMLARVDTMVDKRVSVIQKQFDQKMKDIDTKNNAMLRMQMLELQRKTSTSGRTYSIENSNSINGKKKNSVQEKVEHKLKQDVLAKFAKNGLAGEAQRTQETAEKQSESQTSSMAQTQPQPLTQKERLAKMTEDLKLESEHKSRERSINDRLETDIRRRVTKQERREQSLGAGSGNGGVSYVSNVDRIARPANIPERLEQEDGPRRSSQEPLTDIKIVNVGQEKLNDIISHRASPEDSNTGAQHRRQDRSQETSQDPAKSIQQQRAFTGGSRSRPNNKAGRRSDSSQNRIQIFGDGDDPISTAFGDRQKETGFVSGKVVSRHYQPEASTRMRLTGKGLVIPDPAKEEVHKPPTALDRLQEIQQAQLRASGERREREASGRKTTSEVATNSPGLNYFKKEQPEWNGFVEPLRK